MTSHRRVQPSPACTFYCVEGTGGRTNNMLSSLRLVCSLTSSWSNEDSPVTACYSSSCGHNQEFRLKPENTSTKNVFKSELILGIIFLTGSHILKKNNVTNNVIKSSWWTDLGAFYVVVQVVPEGVDEVDGVVSGIGIGVTWEQDWNQNTNKEPVKPSLIRCGYDSRGLSEGPHQRWCIRCCPRRRRRCPSAPAEAPCGWTAPAGHWSWLADPLWTPTHRIRKQSHLEFRFWSSRRENTTKELHPEELTQDTTVGRRKKSGNFECWWFSCLVDIRLTTLLILL